MADKRCACHTMKSEAERHSRVIQAKSTFRNASPTRNARLSPDKPYNIGNMSIHAPNKGAVPAKDSLLPSALEGVSGNGIALPYRDLLQKSFGTYDIYHTGAHMGGRAASAARRLSALAYTTNEQIAFQTMPDLHMAAHEAAHIVQQRVDPMLKGNTDYRAEKYERHADEVADGVVTGRSAEKILASQGYRSTVPGSAKAMVVQRTVRSNTGHWLARGEIPFRADGSWEPKEILDNMGQNSGKTETGSPTNGDRVQGTTIPDSNTQSDHKRCAAQAAFATAVVAGPDSVMVLCLNLLGTIVRYGKTLDASNRKAGMPDSAKCDKARTKITSVYTALYARPRASLRYEDFDWVVHYLYLFSRDPDRPSGSDYLTGPEAFEAAQIAGYHKLGDETVDRLPTVASLEDRMFELVPGESLLVYYDIDGVNGVDGNYDHTVSFFRDPESRSLFSYDPWTHQVFQYGDKGFDEMVADLFKQALRPAAIVSSYAPGLPYGYLGKGLKDRYHSLRRR